MSVDNTSSVMNWGDTGADLRNGRNAPAGMPQAEIFERGENRMAPHTRILVALGLSLGLWAGVFYVCMRIAF